jgi:hypothetical protein
MTNQMQSTSGFQNKSKILSIFAVTDRTLESTKRTGETLMNSDDWAVLALKFWKRTVELADHILNSAMTLGIFSEWQRCPLSQKTIAGICFEDIPSQKGRIRRMPRIGFNIVHQNSCSIEWTFQKRQSRAIATTTEKLLQETDFCDADQLFEKFKKIRLSISHRIERLKQEQYETMIITT